MLVGGADLVMKMTPSLSEHPPLVHALTVKLYLFGDIVSLASMVLKLEDENGKERLHSLLQCDISIIPKKNLNTSTEKLWIDMNKDITPLRDCCYYYPLHPDNVFHLIPFTLTMPITLFPSP